MGYEELVEILEYKGRMKFNNLIQNTNKSIGLNFFTHVGYYPLNEFMSYVWGKHIDYNPFVINVLLNLQPSHVCGIQNIRSHKITYKMYQIIKNEFCQPISEWVFVNGVSLRFLTR